MSPPERRCAQCGAILLRPRGKQRVGERLWQRRRFCSLGCVWDSRRKPLPVAVCESCGCRFLGRHGQRNRFCCRNCYQAARDPLRRVRYYLEKRNESQSKDDCR